ncbi:MAG: DUF5665 domain-containing protein [Candidatus Brocadiia bacterium]
MSRGKHNPRAIAQQEPPEKQGRAPADTPSSEKPPDDKREVIEKRNVHGVSKTVFDQMLHAIGMEDLVDHKWRLIWLNFLIGLSRGLGFFLGATIVGAAVFWLLQKFVDAPLVGGVINEIMQNVKSPKP